MQNKAATQQTQEALAAKTEMNKESLNTLLKEYELTVNRIEGLDNRFIQIIAGLLGLFGLVVGYFLINPLKIPIPLAWITPAFFITLFMFGNLVVYLVSINVQNARLLTERINGTLGQTDLISYHTNMPGAIYLSPSRGKLKPMYTILCCGVVFLILSIEVFSWTEIYKFSHIQGSLFIVIYGTLSIILLSVILGSFLHLSKFYSKYKVIYPDLNKIRDYPLLHASSIVGRQTFRRTLTTIIPRMPDFLTKGIYLIFGFIVALVVVGVGQSEFSLPIINALFSPSDQWKSLAEVPTWVVWILGAIYLLVEEVLLQQAKLIWNDVRDVSEDKKLLQNQSRPIVSDSMPLVVALAQILVRVVLAFVFGYMLGGFLLVLVFSVIYVHQAVYVLWAKPRAKKHPRLLLFILAFNLPLRFLAGVVAVAGTQWSLAPFLVIFVICYFYSVGGSALQWKIEAEYGKSDDPQQLFDDTHPAPRAQSLFYLKKGGYWQHVGLISAVLVGGFGWLVQWLVQSCNGTALPVVESLYGSCINIHPTLIYTNFGWYSLLVIPVMIIFFTLIAAIFIYLLHLPGRVLARFIQNNDLGKAIKGLAFVLSFCVFLASFYQATIAGSVATLFVSFILFSIFLALMFEGMNYLEFTFENSKRRFTLWVVVCFVFFFEAREGYTWKELWKNIQNIGASQFKPRKLQEGRARGAVQLSFKQRLAYRLIEDLDHAKIRDPQNPKQSFAHLVLKVLSEQKQIGEHKDPSAHHPP